MDGLSGHVGPGQANRPDDVSTVQRHLGRHRRWLLPATPPAVSGQFDNETAIAIRTFQTSAAALLEPDGIVSRRGFTISRLEEAFLAEPRHQVFTPMCWNHSGDGLKDADFVEAAKTLEVEVAAIRAVAETETKRAAWDELGRPSILFERHKFSTHSKGLYNRTHPDISFPTAGGYGKVSAQYTKLYRAAVLHEDAALKAASWGMFQILGENHVASGYDTVAAFVDGMMNGEKAQLDAFVAFVGSHRTMKKALQDKDWATFARRYNGPGYAKDNYDTRMKTNYEARKKAEEQK